MARYVIDYVFVVPDVSQGRGKATQWNILAGHGEYGFPQIKYRKSTIVNPRPYENKENAVKHAVNLAKQNEPCSLYIMKADGKIQEERSYGRENRDIPG